MEALRFACFFFFFPFLFCLWFIRRFFGLLFNEFICKQATFPERILSRFGFQDVYTLTPKFICYSGTTLEKRVKACRNSLRFAETLFSQKLACCGEELHGDYYYQFKAIPTFRIGRIEYNASACGNLGHLERFHLLHVFAPQERQKFSNDFWYCISLKMSSTQMVGWNSDKIYMVRTKNGGCYFGFYFTDYVQKLVKYEYQLDGKFFSATELDNLDFSKVTEEALFLRIA